MAEQRKEKHATVIIVGAGTSGLATAACLSHLSIPYTLLEREDCFASIWNKYSYDRLHLHLAKQSCELPLMPFPAAYPTYVSKGEFTQYLDSYVSHFGIKPSCQRSVETACYDEAAGRWNVKARNMASDDVEEYWSRFLVVATGETCNAFIPQIEGLESFMGEVLHSTRYKNGDRFKNKSVLVVGSGNSGMEISLDLANYEAKTSIVIRSPIHIMSRSISHTVFMLFKYMRMSWVECITILMCKIVYGDMTKYGIQRPKEGPFTMKKKYGKYPVIDVGTFSKIKSGEIQVLPGINSIKANTVVFENGKEYSFDAIVFATGFKRSTKEWLKHMSYAAEDIIESRSADQVLAKSSLHEENNYIHLICHGVREIAQILAGSTSHGENYSYTIFCQTLEKVIENMDSIKNEVMIMQNIFSHYF